MDSLANRQHSCRGSEELAIRKTARFQATPSYSELLRVGGAQELRATPSYSEPLRAALSHSELRIGEYQAPWKSQEARYSHFFVLRTLQTAPSNSERLRATQSYSKDCELHRTLSGNCPRGQPDRIFKLRAAPSYSEPLRATQSYSEWGAPKNSELLRANPSYSEHSEQRLGAASSERTAQKSI